MNNTQKINMTDHQKLQIDNAVFRVAEQMHIENPKSVWMIKLYGKFVKMSSGKSVWKTRAHARTALINHLKRTWIERSICEILGKEYLKDTNELMSFIDPFVEYVEF